MVWEKALASIKSETQSKGYYHWTESYQKFKETFSIEAKQRAPRYLSIDFWDQQRRELTDHGLYVIRFGMGNFIIFNEVEFPRPYTNLTNITGEELPVKQINTHYSLKKAYKIINSNEKSAENTLLELLTFSDIYSQVVQLIDGTDKYFIGPRGGMSSSFNVYLKRKNGAHEKFSYKGQVELDYTIWTENRAYIFEAKSSHGSGLDIGWHKLAYPAQRFHELTEENGIQLTPVYFLRKKEKKENIIYLFIFPDLKFQEGGVILNDIKAMTPKKVYTIDINKFDI